MEDITRRDLLGSAVTAGAGLILSGGLIEQVAEAADGDGPKPIVGAFAGQHKIRPLPFAYGALPGLSERLIKSHWENNYSGAVKALNLVETKLAALVADSNFPPYLYGDYKRELLARTGSVILHERYFANLGGDGKAAGDVSTAIGRAFGSFSMWENEFRKIANGLSGGSGWVVLTYDLHLGQLANYWAWDHMHNIPTGIPLLVLDMYEHAYHMDYGAAAAKYIDAFMKNVNWSEVNNRFLSAKKAADLL